MAAQLSPAARGQRPRCDSEALLRLTAFRARRLSGERRWREGSVSKTSGVLTPAAHHFIHAAWLASAEYHLRLSERTPIDSRTLTQIKETSP
jgi:hypothetical protein